MEMVNINTAFIREAKLVIVVSMGNSNSCTQKNTQHKAKLPRAARSESLTQLQHTNRGKYPQKLDLRGADCFIFSSKISQKKQQQKQQQKTTTTTLKTL